MHTFWQNLLRILLLSFDEFFSPILISGILLENRHIIDFTRVGACLSDLDIKKKDALGSYGKNLGLAFQIADDALDYFSKEKIFGKEIGKDFFEGKVTLPVIIVYQKANSIERTFLINTFKKDMRNKKDLNKINFILMIQTTGKIIL